MVSNQGKFRVETGMIRFNVHLKPALVLSPPNCICTAETFQGKTSKGTLDKRPENEGTGCLLNKLENYQASSMS